jgi:hypothetical protein
MANSVKDPNHAKEADDRTKITGSGAQVPGKTDQPAQEIADDEVEIAETGSKPGEGSRPVTGRKP